MPEQRFVDACAPSKGTDDIGLPVLSRQQPGVSCQRLSKGILARTAHLHLSSPSKSSNKGSQLSQHLHDVLLNTVLPVPSEVDSHAVRHFLCKTDLTLTPLAWTGALSAGLFLHLLLFLLTPFLLPFR